MSELILSLALIDKTTSKTRSLMIASALVYVLVVDNLRRTSVHQKTVGINSKNQGLYEPLLFAL